MGCAGSKQKGNVPGTTNVKLAQPRDATASDNEMPDATDIEIPGPHEPAADEPYADNLDAPIPRAVSRAYEDNVQVTKAQTYGHVAAPARMPKDATTGEAGGRPSVSLKGMSESLRGRRGELRSGKTERQQVQIAEWLRFHPLFCDLTKEDGRLAAVVDAMTAQVVKPHSMVTVAGKVVQKFFLVESGSFSAMEDTWHEAMDAASGYPYYINICTQETVWEKPQTTVLHAGDSFGELGLMYAAVADKTMKAHNVGGKLWVLEGSAYAAALQPSNLNVQDPIQFLDTVPIMQALQPSTRQYLMDRLTEVDYNTGDQVFHPSMPPAALLCIKQGTATLQTDLSTGQSLEEPVVLGPGSAVGESALSDQWEYTWRPLVVATSATQVWCLPRGSFVSICNSLQEAMNTKAHIALLRQSPVLQFLPEAALQGILQVARVQSFVRGDEMVAQGAVASSLVLIQRGRAEAFLLCDKRIKSAVLTLTPGDCFNEQVLVPDMPQESAFTVIALQPTDCLVCNARGLQDVLRKSAAAPSTQAHIRQEVQSRLEVRERKRPVDFQFLEVLGIIGIGGFSIVKLVRNPPTGELYAMKTVSKRHIVGSHNVKAITRERETLVLCDSTFIIRLHSTYQDSEYLFLLTDFAIGSSLEQLFIKKGRFKQRDILFYGANVTLALDYLHDRQVAFRDLKPQNLLLDDLGYIKLTDFGFAKVVPCGTKTQTLCGTPGYWAPEMLANVGHDMAVDWWQLGILMFHMHHGALPFSCEANAPEKTLDEITGRGVVWPMYFSRDMRKFLGALLMEDPTTRMGNAKEMMSHPIFADFGWDFLEQRQLKAPHIPKQKHAKEYCAPFEKVYNPVRDDYATIWKKSPTQQNEHDFVEF